jgi:hypothetical protein
MAVAWVWAIVVCGAAWAQNPEPPALNPFAPNPTASGERDDAVPGCIELSDGSLHVGRVYLTRDKRLKVRDTSLAEERQREVPLRVVKQIDCTVKKEWMEREWRFKELALDQKLYTGRRYPVRECQHTLTLRDGRTIRGDLSVLVYLSPEEKGAEPERYLLHKDQKGKPGQTLGDLVYVKSIKLGDEAVQEGRRKLNK